MGIKSDAKRLNSQILSMSKNRFDLRTLSGLIKPADDSWTITDYLQKTDLLKDQNYVLYLSDTERAFIKERLEHLADNPEVKLVLKGLLTRTVLFIGSECYRLGTINVDQEFTSLSYILTNEYLSLERVIPPTITNFIDEWDRLKPSILFLSCHGDKYGLYMQDENNKSDCHHCGNTELFECFRKRSEYTECVVLSACESHTLGEAIGEFGKHVVCIDSKVKINSASLYLKYFFKYINDHSLDNSEVFEAAHQNSLEKMLLSGIPDTQTFKFIKANKIY
jgi:hypothetical protein